MNINIETLRKTKGIGTKILERIIKQHELDNDIKSFESKYTPNDEYKIDKNINLWQGDCLQLMNYIPNKSVDMILCDLPYGLTWQEWDSTINTNALWSHYNRVLKPKGAVLLFSSGIFTPKIINSNIEKYKYSWYWIKNSKGNYLNAKNQPMRQVEVINVFNNHNYYPQGLKEHSTKNCRGGGAKITLQNYANEWYQEFTGYPSDVLYYDLDKSKVHPTQKPIDLLEYLIKTYTNEDMVVLDNTMGSGSTGVACKNLNRRFIGIELDENYFNIAKERIFKNNDKKE